MEAAEYLNEYAVEARYPGNFPTVYDEEAERALEYVKIIKDYIIDLAKRNNFQI